MTKTIISLDTDQIKKYVFATGTLKEIRGASAILDELNRKQMYEVIRGIVPDAEIIFANGGSGMFEVSDETKGKLCIEAVEKLYRKTTITGSISGALMPYDDRDDFRNIFNTLAYRLRHVKDRKGLSLQPVTHSFLRPCDSCGEEYARYFDHEDMKNEENKEVICESCRRKRKEDRQIKEKIRRVLSGDEKIVETDETWDWLLQKLMETPDYDTKDKERPEDFESIGKLSTPPNYMGLIYADGNSMGKRLEELKSKQDVRNFSKVVDDAIRNAVLESVKMHLKPEGNCFPFDILMLGGDDLVMVTTAHKAIETAITVAKTFREYTGKKFEKCGLSSPVELSVGVAIAHAKFPFGSLLRLAEGLLRFAKTEGAKRSQKGLSDSSEQGLINFQVINASSSMDFKSDFKKNLLYKEESRFKKSGTYYRTLRPYDVKTMEELLINSIRKLKSYQFPKNKIQAFREAVFQEYNSSVFQALSILNRLKGSTRQQLLEVFYLFSKTGSSASILPWFERNGAAYTPFLDIAELYDFIQ